jgi:hypothetical protein
VAVFCDRSVALVADDEDAGGGFDDVVGDGLQFVELKHSGYRGEESGEEVPTRADS